MTLALAVAALEKRQFAKALGPLLAVWDETRSPEVAGFIERASARITRGPVFPVRTNNETRQARWLALAAKRDPADVPRLLLTLEIGATRDIAARRELLRTLPPDPRIDATGDATRTLTADELGTIATLERMLDGAGKTLLQAIYATPTDDALRAIYADWLLQQNDLQGELIHVQLSRTGAPYDLIAKLERRLTGTVIWKVTIAPRVIERGFLHAVTLRPVSSSALAVAATAPEWQTVHEIWLTPSVPRDWLAAPMLRNVRRLHGVTTEVARHLAYEHMLPLEYLGFSGPAPEVEALVQRPGELANLHTFAIEGHVPPSVLAELARSPWRNLVRLEAPGQLATIGTWLRAVEDTSITELALMPPVFALRAPDGTWLIDLPGLDWTAQGAELLAAGLAGVTNITLTIAKREPRYQVHLERALAFLGDRVSYA